MQIINPDLHLCPGFAGSKVALQALVCHGTEEGIIMPMMTALPQPKSVSGRR